MIPRGTIDISVSAIIKGIYYCVCCFFRTGNSSETLNNDNEIVCLSVRTGFDRVLSALNFPAGSHVLVTNINIQHMFNIIAAHNLVPVPLSVNRNTLQISAQQMQAAITPHTKAILITHLFGAIMDTGELIALAKANNIIVIEDCAQAYNGTYNGNAFTDVAMFSFGLIKTHTSVSGGLLRINDAQLYKKVLELNNRLPRQRNIFFSKKLFKVLSIKLLLTKLVYTIFYKFSIWAGKDFDDVLSGFTRGFPGEELFEKIRYRPSVSNEKLLSFRLKRFEPTKITERQKLANDILKDTPVHFKVGILSHQHTYWVMPIQTDKPGDLINYLRLNGFDATQKASSLVMLPSLKGDDMMNDLLLYNLVYVPVYPAMSNTNRKRLSALLTTFK